MASQLESALTEVDSLRVELTDREEHMRRAAEESLRREEALANIQDLARRYGGDPQRYAGQERVILRMRVEKVIRHDQ